MFVISKSVVKPVPYVGPVTSGVELVLNVKDVIENATPVSTAKIIVGRFLNECTPPELLIADKCIMLTGGIIATVATGDNPLVLSGIVSAARSIVRG